MSSCPFCEIIEKRSPAEVVYETEHTLAFFPTEPATRGHTMVIPKSHVESILDFHTADSPELFEVVLKVSRALNEVLQPEGMNIITSAGEVASQSVPHLHIHLVPRWSNDAVGEIWPPKVPTPGAILEDVAESIRDYCNSEHLELRNPDDGD